MASTFHTKNISVVGLLILLICLAVPDAGVAAAADAVRWINVEQLSDVIEKHHPVIVDLRTPEEFGRGHIPGAVNVPVARLQDNRALLDAYRNKPVLLYCRTVNRTTRALGLLEGRGFKMIYALNGGYTAYRLKYP